MDKKELKTNRFIFISSILALIFRGIYLVFVILPAYFDNTASLWHWVRILLTTAPYILFLLYVTVFKNKSINFVAIIFANWTLAELLGFLLLLTKDNYTFAFESDFTLLIPIAIYLSVTIVEFLGMRTRLWTIIVSSYLTLSAISTLLMLTPRLIEYMSISTVYCYISAYIGNILIIVALLVLVVKNRKPHISRFSPEYMLLTLNAQLEKGLISAEEYNARRTEIIGKL
ncbi:MAG: hypothetical protein E7550_04385 [Ruminococcaceae bacterium]|nr:hypothetical protein [Oscillospiraceae bacterium]